MPLAGSELAWPGFPASRLELRRTLPSVGGGTEEGFCNIKGRGQSLTGEREPASCVREAMVVQLPQTRACVAKSKLSSPR